MPYGDQAYGDVPFGDSGAALVAPPPNPVVDVIVLTASGSSAAVTADEFTYTAFPAVSGVSPNIVTQGAAQTVIITGSGFTGATLGKVTRVRAASSGILNAVQGTAPVNLSGVAAGNALIVCLASTGSSAAMTVTGVSDGVNTYSQMVGAYLANGVTMADVWVCKNITVGGGLTVTPTFSASTGGVACVVIEVTGQDTTTFTDKVADGIQTGLLPSSGATPPTTAANEYVVGMVASRGTVRAAAPAFSTALANLTTEPLGSDTAAADPVAASVFDGQLLAPLGVAETFSATMVSTPTVTLCATFLPGGYSGFGSVHLGSTSLAYTVLTDTTISAIVPANLALGTYDLTVTIPAGTSATTLADQVTVVPQAFGRHRQWRSFRHKY